MVKSFLVLSLTIGYICGNLKTFQKMENTSKKSAIKTVLTIAAGVVVGLALVQGGQWAIKKALKKA